MRLRLLAARLGVRGDPCGIHRPQPALEERPLAGIPGVGPWTIEYIAMRALGDPDAYPATDLGLIHALGRKGEKLEHLKPWRAYAATRLWRRAAKKGSRDQRRAR